MQKKVQLDRHVFPTHYNLSITSILEKGLFYGNIEINLKIISESESIDINSIDQVFKEVKVIQNGVSNLINVKEIKFSIKYETATIPISLSKGDAKLCILYDGKINNLMKGFYRTTYKNKDNSISLMAVTQFEPIFARYAFPCWDEPSFKATFTIVLIIPDEYLALSNMDIDKITSKENKKEITFKKTPIMSTYLVAWVIGKLSSIDSKTSNEIKVNIFTPPHQIDQGRFALKTAVNILDFFQSYFQIDYPLPKLDMIAVPDFINGAMENWGMITYRDTAILCDDKSSSSSYDRVALVVIHELSHQWFGNLVTMEWWSQLWLNEGFASYMMYFGANKLFPDWGFDEMFIIRNVMEALELDSLKSSHAIEVDIFDPKEINEMFDIISYRKGASIIRMVHEYIGAEKFREGINHYLNKFKYKNTSSMDLWECLHKVSNKDIKGIMGNFTREIGYPIIEVKTEEVIGDITIYTIKQSRFLLIGNLEKKDTKVIWKIPILIDCEGEKKWEFLESKSMKIKLPSDKKWIKFNFNYSGFYRTLYDEKLLEKLKIAIVSNQLNEMDKINIINDMEALSISGHSPFSKFLTILDLFIEEESFIVWECITVSIQKIKEMIFFTDIKKNFILFTHNLFSKIYKKLGMEFKEDENKTKIKLRANIINCLADFDYPPIIKRFIDIFEKGIEIHPDLKFPLYKTVSRHVGKDAFDKLKSISKETMNPTEKIYALMSLGRVKDEILLKKALEYSISKDVRRQDTFYVVNEVAMNVNGREIAWDWFKNNYDFLRKVFASNTLFSCLVQIVGNFSSNEKVVEINSFFESKDISGYKRKLEQSIEKVKIKARFIENESERSGKWLGKWVKEKSKVGREL